MKPCLMVPFYVFHFKVTTTFIGDIPDPDSKEERKSGSENISHLNQKLRTNNGSWKSIEGKSTADYPMVLFCASLSLNRDLVDRLLSGSYHYFS